MMKLRIVKDGKLVEYERLGECNRCGECCCNLRITCKVAAFTSQDDIDEYDWSDNEGFSVFRAQDLIWYMKATMEEEKKVCSEFEDGACTVWMQDDFPAICRYWPIHPDNLVHFPDCGFSFREA